MSIRLKPLKHQVIVITGGTSGIGLATAHQAVRRGAAVVIAARNGPELERVAAKLRSIGGSVATCVADVSIPDQVVRIATTAVREFGGFDTWVNNAAASVVGSMEQMTWQDHRQVFDVNYFGLLKGSLVAAKHLRRRGGGAIINVGSVMSDRTTILQGSYSASKHAVLAATDAMRMELHRDGIPIAVTLIKPSAMHTPYPEHARNYTGTPVRLPPLLYAPDLVADAILFAAEHPTRDLYVGGSGFLITKLGRTFPRITDWMMEAFAVGLQRAPEDPGDPALRDNLYRSRPGDQIEGNQHFYVRRQSLLLEAQKHPLATIAVGSGVAALALLLTRRRPRHRSPPMKSDAGGYEIIDSPGTRAASRRPR
jgi:NAD(P)-dependent dehydrogenase (short-subunit alcohol dehydrogenase family)